MSLEYKSRINQLLIQGVPNGLYFSEWLKKEGYSDQLLNKYRKSAWLTSLSKGVMYRTGSTLSAYAALSCYNTQLNKAFHVAAHSALEIAGFSHYVPMGKPVLMVAHSKQNIPEWMQSDKFDRTMKLFSTETFTKPQIATMNVDGLDLLVAAPEQAFMECLLLAPNQYNYMDLYYLMEQLTTLRPEVIQHLLETTKSQKIKRIFLYMAEKANHYWYGQLDLSNVEFGISKYQLVEDGAYIAKYKITVPKELNDYE